MDQRLSLMSVHAHPDDEASKGAATVAKYAADGVKTMQIIDACYRAAGQSPRPAI